MQSADHTRQFTPGTKLPQDLDELAHMAFKDWAGLGCMWVDDDINSLGVEVFPNVSDYFNKQHVLTTYADAHCNDIHIEGAQRARLCHSPGEAENDTLEMVTYQVAFKITTNLFDRKRGLTQAMVSDGNRMVRRFG